MEANPCWPRKMRLGRIHPWSHAPLPSLSPFTAHSPASLLAQGRKRRRRHGLNTLSLSAADARPSTRLDRLLGDLNVAVKARRGGAAVLAPAALVELKEYDGCSTTLAPRDVGNIVAGAAEAGRWGEGKKFLLACCARCDMPENAQLFSRALRSLAKLGLPREAEEVMEAAAAVSALTVECHNFFLLAAINGRQHARASAYFEQEMRGKGLPLDRYSFTYYLSSLAPTGRASDALAALQEMRGLGLVPDKYATTAAINACGNSSPAKGKAAMALLRDAEAAAAASLHGRSGGDGSGSAKSDNGSGGGAVATTATLAAALAPDAVMYSATIAACGRAGSWQDGLRLLQDMADAGLQPNPYALSAAVAACGAAEPSQWERALAVLRAAPPRAASTAVYNAAMLALLRARRLAEGLELLQEMRARKVPRGAKTFLFLLRLCRTCRDGQTALAILKAMPGEDSVAAVSEHYEAVVGALVASGRSDDAVAALSLLDEICASGAADSATLTALLNAVDSAGDWRAALQLMAVARAAGLGTNAGLINAAVRALSRRWRWTEVLTLYADAHHEAGGGGNGSDGMRSGGRSSENCGSRGGGNSDNRSSSGSFGSSLGWTAPSYASVAIACLELCSFRWAQLVHAEARTNGMAGAHTLAAAAVASLVLDGGSAAAAAATVAATGDTADAATTSEHGFYLAGIDRQALAGAAARAMRALSGAGDHAGALRLYNGLAAFGVESLSLPGLRVKALAGAGRSAEAEEALAALAAAGTLPGATMCAAVVAALGRDGKWREALEVADVAKEWHRAAVAAGAAAADTAAGAACGAAAAGSTGANHEAVLAGAAAAPSPSTAVQEGLLLTAAVAACAKSRRLGEAVRLLREARKDGIMPSGFAWTTTIACCGQVEPPRGDLALALLAAACEDADAAAVTADAASAGANADTSAIEPAAAASTTTAGGRSGSSEERRESSLTTTVFNAAIQALSRARRLEDGLEVLNEMFRRNVPRDASTYNSAFELCRTGGEYWRVPGLLAMMRSDGGVSGTRRGAGAGTGGVGSVGGVAPDRCTFNTAIAACEPTGDVAQAEQLFAEMVASADVSPNIVSYNALMSVMVAAGQYEQALTLLPRLQAAGLLPDRVTFATLIAACDRAARPADCLCLLTAARAAGQLSPHAFASTISSFGHAKDWRGALALLREARSVGAANVVGFAATIKVCNRAGRWQEAQLVLSDMKAAGVAPNDYANGGAVWACVSAGEHRRAIALFDAIVAESGGASGTDGGGTAAGSSDVPGRLSTAPAVSLTRAAEWRRQATVRRTPDATVAAAAVPMVEAAAGATMTAAARGSTGSTVGHETFAAALSAAQQGRFFADGIRILRSMPRYGVPRSLASFNAGLALCEAEGAGHTARALLRLMAWNGIRPTAVSFNRAVAAHTVVGAWQDAAGLLLDMARQEILPGNPTVLMVLRACLTAAGPRQAVRLAVDVAAAAGTGPPLALLSSLVSSYHQSGDYDAADDIFATICDHGALVDGFAASTAAVAPVNSDAGGAGAGDGFGDKKSGVERLLRTTRAGPLEIDLHGYSVPLAHTAVRVSLRHLWALAQRGEPLRDLVVIVGIGRRSTTKFVPALRPEVQSMLSERFYPPIDSFTKPGNPGRLVIPASAIRPWVEHSTNAKRVAVQQMAAVLAWASRGQQEEQ